MSDFVAVIIGTRPEAIKMAPVVLALRERGVDVRIVSTGQHRDLLHGALAAFDLRADLDLLTMRDGQDLPGLTARLVSALSETLQAHRPCFTLVQGDATTTLAGALVCFYLKIPCGHVEAGLRSEDLHAPWPEEMNRRLADQLCRHHYPPTERARRNLIEDGIDSFNIIVTGQTGVDAALLTSERLDGSAPPEIAGIVRERELLVYATAHRRESFDGKIRKVVEALHSIVMERPDVRVVLPAHPNPNVTREISGLAGMHERLHIIDPVSYPCSIWLMRHAAVIVSDSGGIQEEAPSFGVPVLVTRDVTERPEGVDAGFLRLVGTSSESVSQHLRAVLQDPHGLKQRLRDVPNPFGDGRASIRIADDVARIVGALSPR